MGGSSENADVGNPPTTYVYHQNTEACKTNAVTRTGHADCLLNTFTPGTDNGAISMPVKDWLAAGGVALDDDNTNASPDYRDGNDNYPTNRHTGVLLTINIKYDNFQNPNEVAAHVFVEQVTGDGWA